MLEHKAPQASLEALGHMGAREAQICPPLGRPPVAVLGLEVGAAPQPGLLEGCTQACSQPWTSAWQPWEAQGMQSFGP